MERTFTADLFCWWKQLSRCSPFQVPSVSPTCLLQSPSLLAPEPAAYDDEAAEVVLIGPERANGQFFQRSVHMPGDNGHYCLLCWQSSRDSCPFETQGQNFKNLNQNKDKKASAMSDQTGELMWEAQASLENEMPGRTLRGTHYHP